MGGYLRCPSWIGLESPPGVSNLDAQLGFPKKTRGIHESPPGVFDLEPSVFKNEEINTSSIATPGR